MPHYVCKNSSCITVFTLHNIVNKMYVCYFNINELEMPLVCLSHHLLSNSLVGFASGFFSSLLEKLHLKIRDIRRRLNFIQPGFESPLNRSAICIHPPFIEVEDFYTCRKLSVQIHSLNKVNKVLMEDVLPFSRYVLQVFWRTSHHPLGLQENSKNLFLQD